MKVKATERGYDNVTVREPGDVFDMPEGSVAPWFEPVVEKQQSQQASKKGNKDTTDLV